MGIEGAEAGNRVPLAMGTIEAALQETDFSESPRLYSRVEELYGIKDHGDNP